MQSAGGKQQSRHSQSSQSYFPVRSQSPQVDGQDGEEDRDTALQFEQSGKTYIPLGANAARGRSMSDASQRDENAQQRGRSGSAASDPAQNFAPRRSWSPVDAPPRRHSRGSDRGKRLDISPTPAPDDRVRSASPAVSAVGSSVAKPGGSVAKPGGSVAKPGGSVGIPGGSLGVPGGQNRPRRPSADSAEGTGTPSPGRGEIKVPRKRSVDENGKTSALGSGVMPKRRPSAEQKVGGSVAKVGGSVASVGSSVASVGRPPGSSLGEPGYRPDLGEPGYRPEYKQSPRPLLQGQATAPETPQAPVDGPDIPRLRLSVLSLGWAFGAVSWVLGMAFHSISIEVMPGTPLQRMIHKSVFGSLEVLQENHAWLSYCMLGSFSVVIPVSKILGTLWLIYCTANKPVRVVFESHKCMGKALKLSSSYQFVDLYVAILFIAFFNSDSSNAEVGIGFYFFFNYCLVSTAVSALLEDTFERMKDAGAEQASAENQQQISKCLRSTVVEGVDYVHTSLDLGPAAGASTGSGARDMTGEVPGKDIEQPGGLPSDAEALDRRAVYFFSFSSMILILACSFSDWLEMRLMLSGVSLDRNPLTLASLMFSLLPACVHPGVMVFVWLFLGVFPALYAGCLCMRATLKGPPASLMNLLQTLTDWLRQWAMLDVFAIASLIALCMLQDAHTLTMPGDGSYAYFVFLAAAYAFFFLRWFVEGDFSNWCSSMWPSGKFWVLTLFWLGTCIFLLHGVPGAYPHYQFPTLTAVCDHGSTVLNHMIPSLPNSFGDCDDEASDAPKPCKGDAPLYDKGPDVKAVWISGLNSMSVTGCSLTKSPLQTGHTAFSLSISGTFEEIKLFLRVNTMGVKMDSPDHCCGKNIRYSMKLVLDCLPDPVLGAIKGIRLESFDISSMMVEEKIGMLTIDAMDLSTLLKNLVKERINIVINKVELSWAGHKLKLPEMLDKLVSYNAPEREGQC